MVLVIVKAYIPLRRKTIRVGSWRWLGPPTPQFCVTYTNMLVSKNAKICVPPDANLKFALPPTPTPNASQWNIGCVGSPMQDFRICNVHFIFGVISFAFGGQRKPSCQWNMGLRVKRSLSNISAELGQTHIAAFARG